MSRSLYTCLILLIALFCYADDYQDYDFGFGEGLDLYPQTNFNSDGWFKGGYFIINHMFENLPDPVLFRHNAIIGTTTASYQNVLGSYWVRVSSTYSGTGFASIIDDGHNINVNVPTNLGTATFTDTELFYPDTTLNGALGYLANAIQDITDTIVYIGGNVGYKATIGGYDSFNVSHQLGTRDVVVSVYELGTNKEVFPIKAVVDDSHVMIKFASAIPIESHVVIIMKSTYSGLNQTSSNSFTFTHDKINPVIFRLSYASTNEELDTKNYTARLIGSSTIEFYFNETVNAGDYKISVAAAEGSGSIGSSTSPSDAWYFYPVLQSMIPLVLVYDKNGYLVNPLIEADSSKIIVKFGELVSEDAAYTMVWCKPGELQTSLWIDIQGNNCDLATEGAKYGRYWIDGDYRDLSFYRYFTGHSKSPSESGDSPFMIYYSNYQWLVGTLIDDLSLMSGTGYINIMNNSTLRWNDQILGDRLLLWGDTYKITIDNNIFKFTSGSKYEFWTYGSEAADLIIYADGSMSTKGNITSGNNLVATNDTITTQDTYSSTYQFNTDDVGRKINFGFNWLYGIELSNHILDIMTDTSVRFYGAGRTNTVVINPDQGSVEVDYIHFKRTYTAAQAASSLRNGDMFILGDGGAVALSVITPTGDIEMGQSVAYEDYIASPTLTTDQYAILGYVVGDVTRYALFSDRER